MEKKRSVVVSTISIVIIVSNILAIVVFLRSDVLKLIPTFEKLLMSLFPFIAIFLNYHLYKAGVIFSLLFIALGASILMKKEIARKIFISLEALFLIIGLASVAFVLFWYSEARHQGMSVIDYITTQLLPSILMFCLFPLLFLIYFTRPKVKEQFK